MRHDFHIVNEHMALQTGMTIIAYDYTSASPYYTTSQASPLTATAATETSGKYYFDVTTTGKYTIVITKDDSTLQTLNVQKWLEGDDEVQNPVT